MRLVQEHNNLSNQQRYSQNMNQGQNILHENDPRLNKKQANYNHGHNHGQQRHLCQPQNLIIHQASQSEPKRIVHGAGKITNIIYFFAPFILIAPMISYYLAVKNKQQHPYPHPTITDTACHYPQDIEFRFFMAGSGSFMSLVYYVLFKWIKFQKQRVQYPGTIYGKLHLLCQISVWGFMAAMGTIDGAWYPLLHDISAVFFFIVLFILVITHTIVLRDMYNWDPSVMSKTSCWIKTILGLYVALVWVYTVIGLATQPSQSNDDENVFIVILEWNTVYVCVFWIVSYIPDWKNLHYTLTQYTNE